MHGVGKQYLSEDSLARDVVPELRGGTRLAGGPVPNDDEVHVAFYGDLFRPRGARTGHHPRYDAADVETEEEFALLMAWWAEAARTDPDVPGPDEVDGRGLAAWAASRTMRLRSVRAALDALTGARFLRGVLDRVLIGDLKQVTDYFTNASVRSAARERVAARITPETRVVVAHSLGSVIAYETLCDSELSAGWNIHTLVTLGSPLGMGALVLDRLQPEPVGRRAAWPTPLWSWTNIADTTDIVSAIRELRPAFGSRVTDLTVCNGAHMHDVSRYLTAVETGQAITAGLRRENWSS
ncbi:hypothetical protein GCM10010357_34380 [Streptomyces luteireticuli]|uniref:Antibiotic ABC transporter ATP-binding protein n=1 Tax=Streptomyces luteireticuli TaxID=173858 RepID=A0ABP3IM90_9ACTN